MKIGNPYQLFANLAVVFVTTALLVTALLIGTRGDTLEGDYARTSVFLGDMTDANPLKTLREKGIIVSLSAGSLLMSPEFTKAEKKEERDVIVVNVAYLGFTRRARYHNILERARRKGLEPCFAETAPQILLQCDRFIVRHELFLAMEPIQSDGLPLIFSMGDYTNNRQWLYTEKAGKDTFFPTSARFAFFQAPDGLVQR